MQSSLSKLHSLVLSALEPGDGTLGAEAERYVMAFQQALRAAEQPGAPASERILLETIRREFATYSRQAHAWLEPQELELPGPRPSSEAMVMQVQKILRLTKQLIESQQHDRQRSNEEYARLGELINYLRLVFFIGGPAIGLILGVRVAQGLRGSIFKLSSQLKDATKGLNSDGKESGPSCELPALEDQVNEVSDHVSRLVQELDKARQYSARSERLVAVGVLAAGVAHELRNPLTSVKLMVQTAALRFRDRPLSDRQFQVLQDGIGRMEQSIQSLLDFACMPKPHCVPHDLRDTVERAINIVSLRATQLKIEITHEFMDAPALIYGDPAQLQSVFANLLLNGMEAMPGGGRLHVAIHDAGRDEDYCVEISDTGRGIPAELMDRLFEPFVAGGAHGYGLGLTISRRIVKEHGGTIWAANRPGGGAIFTLDLPRATKNLASRHVLDKQEFAHVQAVGH